MGRTYHPQNDKGQNDRKIPCESLGASRAHKYTGIKAKLEYRGYDTVLDALLIGSLG